MTMGPSIEATGKWIFLRRMGRDAQTTRMSISSPRRATAGVQLSISRRLGPLFEHNAVLSDVNMGSNLAVNLNGTGTTIQANGNIFVASDGTFGACAQDILADANSEGETDSEFTVLRVVN